MRLEAIGAFLIFKRHSKLDAQLHAAGFMFYEGKAPPGFESSISPARLGFGCLFVGMLLAGLSLSLEHRALLAERCRKLDEPTT